MYCRAKYYVIKPQLLASVCLFFKRPDWQDACWLQHHEGPVHPHQTDPRAEGGAAQPLRWEHPPVSLMSVVSIPLFWLITILIISLFCRNTEAQTELNTWGLNFDNKLLSLTGRVLPAERIVQGSRTVYKPTQNQSFSVVYIRIWGWEVFLHFPDLTG